MTSFVSNRYNTLPDCDEFSAKVVSLHYEHTEFTSPSLELIIDKTPFPKGRTEFSTIHIIAPFEGSGELRAESALASLRAQCVAMSKEFTIHRLNTVDANLNRGDALWEFNAIFEVSSSLLLKGADRASLVIYIGSNSASFDSFAAFIGMLPFRGISMALLTQRVILGDISKHVTPSGVFRCSAGDSQRMGMFPIYAVFGDLESASFEIPVTKWEPIHTDSTVEENPEEAIPLSFKIGGLVLPMLNHNAGYYTAIAALANLIERYYAAKSEGGGEFYPIISCGETCDALGYGSDILSALTGVDSVKREGFYFTHKSGENNKCADNYADPDLFGVLIKARARNKIPLIIAVGGGVNGNSIGLMAALTGSDFIEVPTTPMHFNDATTSAKKAFSLVKNNVILSKNILGAFYLPSLVFCVSEMILTINTANAHATVGEATKTMNMLGNSLTPVGADDYSNILGASEFASDFTKILTQVSGFEKLVTYIQSSKTEFRFKQILRVGKAIKELRKELALEERWEQEASHSASLGGRGRGLSNTALPALLEDDEQIDFSNVAVVDSPRGDTNRVGPVDFTNLQEGEGISLNTKKGMMRSSVSYNGFTGSGFTSNASLSSLDSLGRSRGTSSASEEDLAFLQLDTQRSRATSNAGSDDGFGFGTGVDISAEDDEVSSKLEKQLLLRSQLMNAYRDSYYQEVADEDKLNIKAFLTTINTEIVKAKAMFLAYEDPFEKYRALLFEYAHTLGHGIEAFANALYARAEKKKVEVPSSAQRLHGQCVGMAVIMAGQMSSDLGVLQNKGLQLHQSLVFLFNRFGGFTFAPIRELCEKLQVELNELVEGVLKVVRRDNKRGYCQCSDTASVDQLVVGRCGKMLRSRDTNAELRYLVQVPETMQEEMLRRAWNGDFDLCADLVDEELVFVPYREDNRYASSSDEVASYIHESIADIYANPEEIPEDMLYCQPCN